METLPEGSLKVLDAYSGNSLIWRHILNRRPDTNVVRIDSEDYYKGVYLKGDNIKFLKTMPLEFNVVDLDAYGIPFKQLEILFDRKYKGAVYITFIQSLYGQLNKDLLEFIGYPKRMTEKIPTLFNKDGFGKLKQYLAMKGISRIKHISTLNKHYVYINML